MIRNGERGCYFLIILNLDDNQCQNSEWCQNLLMDMNHRDYPLCGGRILIYPCLSIKKRTLGIIHGIQEFVSDGIV